LSVVVLLSPSFAQRFCHFVSCFALSWKDTLLAGRARTSRYDGVGRAVVCAITSCVVSTAAVVAGSSASSSTTTSQKLLLLPTDAKSDTSSHAVRLLLLLSTSSRIITLGSFSVIVAALSG
jgi:hypothetical protein